MAEAARHRRVTRAPTFDDIFEVMSKASVGEHARVPVPEEPDLEDVPTRFAMALNLLLDDLAQQAAEAQRNALVAEEARAQRRQFELERLQEVNRLKNQIINTSAHEFNTPLTPLLLNAHLLGTEALGPLTAGQQAALRVVERSLNQLARLVRDMLDVSRLQDGRLQLRPEPGDLRDALRQAQDDFREPARAAGVGLELEPGPPLPAAFDAQRVQQVLANLVANALRATPRGGRVTLAGEAAGASVVVRVRDTGLGLAPGQLAALFQPFSQVHADTRKEQAGSGLGLFICKGIVEQHGGRVEAASEGPGKGATFSFTLPREGPAPGPGPQAR